MHIPEHLNKVSMSVLTILAMQYNRMVKYQANSPKHQTKLILKRKELIGCETSCDYNHVTTNCC